MPVPLTIKPTGRSLGIIALLVLSLTGCGLIQDRSEDYRNETLTDGLEVPEGLSAARIDPVYPIPDAGASPAMGQADSELPPPPDLTENILDENYVIESTGEGQAWLLVNELPGQVWPAVTGFLAEQGLELAHENPRIGLMQSEPVDFSLRARQWLGLEEAPSDLVTLVQARVSPGVRRNTTEVQLRVRKVGKGEAEGFMQWPPQSDALEKEKALLQSMADTLKGQEDIKTYSRAAIDIAESPRVRLVAPADAAPYIELDLTFERAWAEVNRALEDARVPLVDINRSEGQWFVDYRNEDERTTGWLFWRGLDEPRYTYQVELETTGDGTPRVTTRQAPDYAAGHEGGDRSERLLSEIYEYLY